MDAKTDFIPTRPVSTKLETIAEALGCSVAAFNGGSTNCELESTLEMFRLWQMLNNDEGRRAVINVIRSLVHGHKNVDAL